MSGGLKRFNTKGTKLPTAGVKEMYARLQSGELTQGEAARLYGLGVVQVGRIARGESRANETGARENPVPNFGLQTGPADVAASVEKLNRLMDEVPRAVPSLYDSPPPTADEDQAAAERALSRLNEELKPTAKQQELRDELDKLKGD
jgi:hypothetical protein